jgi:hypothetical protein
MTTNYEVAHAAFGRPMPEPIQFETTVPHKQVNEQAPTLADSQGALLAAPFQCPANVRQIGRLNGDSDTAKKSFALNGPDAPANHPPGLITIASRLPGRAEEFHLWRGRGEKRMPKSFPSEVAVEF